MVLTLPSTPLNLPESNLNLPSESLKLPVAQQPKGFFETLRNPIDLMRYESLPVAAYQYMSGNAKEVQAKQAQQFIDNNHSNKRVILLGDLKYSKGSDIALLITSSS